LMAAGGAVTEVSSPSSLVDRDADGHVIFRPSTSRDQWVTTFLPAPVSSERRQLIVELTAAADAADNCVLYLQDQNLRALGSMRCRGSDGTQTATWYLNPEVSSVRAYFLDPQKGAITLPESIAFSFSVPVDFAVAPPAH
jgi:hypothetical protein